LTRTNFERTSAHSTGKNEHPMNRTTLILVFGCLALGACSGNTTLSNLSTGSIFGGAKPPETPAGTAQTVAAPAAPVSTPTDRAFQVGSVTARATKCGYNFDPAKLKANYMAYETSLGLAPADTAKIDKIYTVAFNGTTKAAASDPNYCNEKKTKEIKEDLGKLLAGDYTPTKRKVAAADQDEGLFGGMFGGGSDGASDEYKATLPTDNSRDGL
jgi:hypothetical protein